MAAVLAAFLLENAPTIISILGGVIVYAYTNITKAQAARAQADTAQVYADMVAKYAQAAIGYVAEKNARLVNNGKLPTTPQDKLILATDFLLAQCKMQNITMSTDSAVQLITATLAFTSGEGATGDRTISTSTSTKTEAK